MSRGRRRAPLAVLLAALLSCPAPASAFPGYINYQGKLGDPSAVEVHKWIGEGHEGLRVLPRHGEERSLEPLRLFNGDSRRLRLRRLRLYLEVL